MNLKKYIGNWGFYRSALLLAIPIMLQNGITNFVSLLDNIMVGAVGTVQMSGVSIANTLLFVFNLAIFGAVSGAGIFGAQFYGMGDHDGIRYTMRYKLVIGLLLLVLGILTFSLGGEGLIRLYLKGEGTAAEIADTLYYGKGYLSIMLWGIPAFVLTQCYAGTLRETGHSVLPMVAGLIAVAVNLTFNWILIFGKYGAPALGAFGAAIATVLSRYAEAAIVILWTHCHKEKNPFARGLFHRFSIPKGLARRITVQGMPLLLNEALWAGGIALLNQCYSMRGYDVISATNIHSTVHNVCNVVILAMGTAIGIIVGQLLGANRVEEAKDTDRKLVVFSVVISVFPLILLCLLSDVFPQLYNTTDSVRSLAGSFMRITACIMPFSAYANAVYFTLRSGGKTYITILFDSVFSCAVVAPVAFVLSRFTSLPILPLFAICQGLELVKCIVGYFLLRSGLWIQNIVEEKPKKCEKNS